MGWRGPDRTCPGFGAVPPADGMGLAAGAGGRPGAITAAGGMAGFVDVGASGGAGGAGDTVGGAGFAAAGLGWPPMGG